MKVISWKKKSDVDGRGSVHSSGNQIKIVMETMSSSKEKNTWDLDKQAIQIGRNTRNLPAMVKGGMGREHEATQSWVAEMEAAVVEAS